MIRLFKYPAKSNWPHDTQVRNCNRGAVSLTKRSREAVTQKLTQKIYILDTLWHIIRLY